MSETNPNDPAGPHETKEGRWAAPMGNAQTQEGKRMPTVAKGISDGDELPKFQHRLGPA